MSDEAHKRNEQESDSGGHSISLGIDCKCDLNEDRIKTKIQLNPYIKSTFGTVQKWS